MPRKNFDGHKLAADVARLIEADAQSPPQSRPSLMDVVRSLVGFVDARARLGWTDTMIARVLTEAGYPIGAATLRSYRKRMRDEGLSGEANKRPASVPLPVAVAEPLPPATPTVSIPANANASVPHADAPTHSRSSAQPSLAQSQTAAPSQRRRTFSVDRSNLPPDRA